MWDIFDEIRRMQEEMDRMFGDFYGRRYSPMLGPGKAMAEREERRPSFREAFCDIQETDKEIIVTAELPGMEKKDIKVDVKSDAIEIKAEKKSEEKKEEEGRSSYVGYHAGFYRTIPLPSAVEADKAKAIYNNGVLEISIPKTRTSEGKSLRID